MARSFILLVASMWRPSLDDEDKMFSIDLRGKTALITGGTRGIGLGIGEAFASAGATVILTYRWGGADLDQIKDSFVSRGFPAPRFEMADVSHREDTEALMGRIKEDCDGVDLFVNNVAFAGRPATLKEYRKRSLYKSLDYSAWPLVEYLEVMEATFGRYPGHVVAISSDGMDRSYPGYDFVAISKSVLEVMTRYLGSHLKSEGTKVNAIRFGMVATESFESMFGAEIWEFLRLEGIEKEDLMTPEECGKAVLALCSGLLDGMQSEVVTVDKAMAFEDNLMRRYQRWQSTKE